MSATASTRAIAWLAVTLPGRDHVERGGAMRGSKIGQRLGGALEILGPIIAGSGTRGD